MLVNFHFHGQLRLLSRLLWSKLRRELYGGFTENLSHDPRRMGILKHMIQIQ